MDNREIISEVADTARTFCELAHKFLESQDPKTARLLVAYGVTLAEGTREVRKAVNAIRATPETAVNGRPIAEEGAGV